MVAHHSRKNNEQILKNSDSLALANSGVNRDNLCHNGISRLVSKGSASYLLMKETHYNAGVFVWCLMIIRLILKHKYDDPAITPTPPSGRGYQPN